MFGSIKLTKGVRRVSGAVVAVLFLAGFGMALYANHAHAARVHVRVPVAAAGEIVQVLVNCQVEFYYGHDAPIDEDVDLGWLEKGDILTFQVRGRRPPGYYELAFAHDSHVEDVGSVGSALHRVLMPPARMIFSRSYTVGGLPLQRLPCQGDSSTPPLELAGAAVAATARRGGPDALMDSAVGVAARWETAMAILGALTLIFAPVLGRSLGAVRSRRRRMADVLLAAVGGTLGILWATAREHNLVAPVCIAAGIGALFFIVYRLLVNDMASACAWWLRRRAGP
jgi:hypothetical protein